jgi:hypothetical protein
MISRKMLNHLRIYCQPNTSQFLFFLKHIGELHVNVLRRAETFSKRNALSYSSTFVTQKWERQLTEAVHGIKAHRSSFSSLHTLVDHFHPFSLLSVRHNKTAQLQFALIYSLKGRVLYNFTKIKSRLCFQLYTFSQEKNCSHHDSLFEIH